MIEVKNLSKSFDEHQVLKGIDFSVNKGEVLGFLGPNGAGKSTTMKILTGFLDFNEGQVQICGHDVVSEKALAQSKIGYVPENAPLYDEMYVDEFLKYIAEMRGLQGNELAKRVKTVINLCSLHKVLTQVIGTLSKGYKRRVSVAQALIHDPEILILDEPTDGLDPNQKHDVRKLIRQMSSNKVILISTHIMEEVNAVCDKCLVLSNGKVQFIGTSEELQQTHPDKNLDEIFRELTLGGIHNASTL